jgi:hypothetical protein
MTYTGFVYGIQFYLMLISVAQIFSERFDFLPLLHFIFRGALEDEYSTLNKKEIKGSKNSQKNRFS